MSKKVYGIDLGTTYSAISTLDDRGMPEMIQNFFDSEDLLASVVYFPEVGDPVVGKEAKNQAEISPQDVVQYIKREIGKEHAQTRIFGGQPYDAISISALILKRLKEYAEDQGHEVRDVVITCPAYFGNEERDATRQAGTIAGLNVLNIVNEPTAAALNYCCREYQENRKIMVYDLGGGTFDVTLFDFAVDENGKASIVVLGTGGDDQLGGIDWDNRLYNQICKLYADENGIDTNSFSAELRQKLRAVVEETKRSLTGLQSRSFTINHAGDSTRLEVTRQGFEELTHDLVARTISFVHKLLGEAAVAPEAVDVVLLVGGSTRMPMVRTAVEGIFPGKVRMEQPDLAVAKGAALAAAVEWNERIAELINETEKGGDIEEKAQELGIVTADAPPLTKEQARHLVIGHVPAVVSNFQDILSRSFGPAVFNHQGDYVIDNLLFVGDPNPSEATQTYGTLEAAQEIVEFYVFENVANDRVNSYVTPALDANEKPQHTDPALKVKTLGKVTLALPPNTPQGAPIEVFFRCSTLGLEVRAHNPQTGETVEVLLESGHTKTPEELAAEVQRFSGMRTKGEI